MRIAAISEVVWYVTGRFYAPENSTAVADYGYFLHVAGITDPLFEGAVGEARAHLTFAAQPFVPCGASNDGYNFASLLRSISSNASTPRPPVNALMRSPTSSVR